MKQRINKKAGIRELHVYGQATELGKKGNVQHRGLGKKLIKTAEIISKVHNKNKIFIISGIGVRPYYSRLGYKRDGFYMSKNL